MLRDFPHCFHQSFRIKICVAAKGPHVIGRQLGAPGTMGKSRQVDSDKTADGRNRTEVWWSEGYLKMMESPAHRR